MFDSMHSARWILATSMLLTAPATFATAAQVDNALQPPADAASDVAQLGPRIYRCPLHVERILPAYYYSCRALYYFQRHKVGVAMAKLKEAARWADKRAQYSLGLIYFNGDDGIPADHARGLAWLGMAVERKNPEYMRSYAAAMSRSTPDELARAGRLWQQLNLEYSDKVAGARAVNTYNRALKELADMSFGTVGGATRWGYTSEAANSEHVMSELDRMAATVFGGMQGTVTVGKPAGETEAEPAAPRAAPAPARPPAAPER
jgi:TPR repeat protein